jgi:hypothetical protein
MEIPNISFTRIDSEIGDWWRLECGHGQDAPARTDVYCFLFGSIPVDDSKVARLYYGICRECGAIHILYHADQYKDPAAALGAIAMMQPMNAAQFATWLRLVADHIDNQAQGNPMEWAEIVPLHQWLEQVRFFV